MVELHERLSEFSYGYGVTREVEGLLAGIGLRPVPFLPSLLHEADLGFDVGFDKPGAALMLQFKLGQSLTRYYHKPAGTPKPHIDRPFWRYAIDTAEPEGQFETLLKAETDGAEVYYVAPRFRDWPHYANLFENGEVLENSLLIRPSEIRGALDTQGAADGPHRIIYDRYRVHVCSEPTRIFEADTEELTSKIAYRVREIKQPMRDVLARVFDGFDRRYLVRNVDEQKYVLPGTDLDEDPDGRMSGDYARKQRHRRFAKLLDRAKSEDHALAAAVGVELWTMGIQLVAVTED